MLRRLTVLLCVCAVFRTAQSGPVTTPDTFVVSKDDEAPTPSPEMKPTSPSSTVAPLPTVKLSEMSVDSEVSLRYAHTAVVTRVRNPASRAQETTFRVLLPETAFISGFVMTLDGKSYKAYVKEKEEAKQIYNEAVSQGIGAAHIATKARDSNHFTVSVNIEPNSEAVFNLTYEELLTRRNGVYNHAINLHPGALVPRLTVKVHVKETNAISTLRVPEVRTGNEIDADENDAQNKKAVIVKSSDGKEATITFTPDLDEQKRLMEVYAQKSKESRDRVHVPWYSSQSDNDDQKDTEGVLGQFVVQYDVDRPKGGEIMVSDGYFVHFFAPSSLPPLNKHVVFVLDTSGSMMDRKIEQLRDAMTSILDELNKGDYFSIVEFSSDVTVHDLKEADQEEKKVNGGAFNFDYTEKPVTLVPPSEVNEDNIKKAKIIVKRLRADGGTNIGRALEIATQLIRKGINWTPTPGNTTAEVITPLPLTDGNTTELSGTEAPTTGDKEEKEIKVEEETQRLVPIIIFLTDGEPTVGTTDTKKIISTLSEQNYGYNKAAIYSLAFGEDADRSFLRKLSLRNEGFMRHIYEAADAALQLRHFYREVSSPLLADVKFTYPSDQVKEDSLTKRKFRTFYAESETIVAGRIADEATELSAEISGFCGVDDGVGRKKYRISPKVPVPREPGVYFPLERMWAYLTIKQLLDERDAADDDISAESVLVEDSKNTTQVNATDEKTPAKKALEIALKYEFVTPLTSLVVVKPNASNTVDAESVDKLQDDLGNRFGGPLSSYQPLSISGGFPPPAASYSFHSAPQFASSYASSGFYTKVLGGSRPAIAFSSYPSLDRHIGLPGPPAPESFQQAVNIVLPSITPQNLAPGSPGPSPISLDQSPVLSAYALDSYPWLAPIVNSTTNQITLPDRNGKAVVLKLAKQGDATDLDSQECSKSVSGSSGKCVYLSRCTAAQNITLAVYEDIYCSTTQGFAGVCCPEDAIRTI